MSHKPTPPRSRTWTVAVSAGAGLVIGAAAVSGVSASWADPSPTAAQPAQVQLTEQRPVTAVDPAAGKVSTASVWTPQKLHTMTNDFFTSARELAADQKVESVSMQSVQSVENQVSVQSAQSTSWDSPDSPDSPTSWDSPASPDSPDSIDSPDSPDSVDSWDSPDSPDSVDSPDW